MQNIHNISIGTTQAWIWASITGGNGSILGRRNNQRTAHSFLGIRQPPPPMDRNGNHRAYHYPWGHALRHIQTIEEALTPACGRIKSDSREPYVQPTEIFTERRPWGMHPCPECLTAGPNTVDIRTLQETDPWHLMSYNERATQLDPISGM